MPTLYGVQEGDSEKTPTLRQYVNAGRVLPVRNYVKTLFLPNKSGSYGLVTDSGFRVAVPETSGLFPTLRSLFDDIADHDLCLFITVTDPERCHWQLESCDRNITEWEVTNWGLRSTRLAIPVSETERTANKKGRRRNPSATTDSGTAGSSLNGRTASKAR